MANSSKPITMTKTTLYLIGLLLCVQTIRPSGQGWAQQASPSDSPAAPGLEYVCSLLVKIAPALVVGETPHGTRRIVPITGGTFGGPTMKGEVLTGGADWQVVRADGVAEL